MRVFVVAAVRGVFEQFMRLVANADELLGPSALTSSRRPQSLSLRGALAMSVPRQMQSVVPLPPPRFYLLGFFDADTDVHQLKTRPIRFCPRRFGPPLLDSNGTTETSGVASTPFLQQNMGQFRSGVGQAWGAFGLTGGCVRQARVRLFTDLGLRCY